MVESDIQQFQPFLKVAGVTAKILLWMPTPRSNNKEAVMLLNVNLVWPWSRGQLKSHLLISVTVKTEIAATHLAIEIDL